MKKVRLLFYACAALAALFCLNCSTITTQMLVKRAPKYFLAEQGGKVAIKFRDVKGGRILSSQNNCGKQGGKISVKLEASLNEQGLSGQGSVDLKGLFLNPPKESSEGTLSPDTLDMYEKTVMEYMQSVFSQSKKPITIVSEENADTVLSVSLVITETRAAQMNKTGEKNSAIGDCHVDSSMRLVIGIKVDVIQNGRVAKTLEDEIYGSGMYFMSMCEVSGEPDDPQECVQAIDQVCDSKGCQTKKAYNRPIPYDLMLKNARKDAFGRIFGSVRKFFVPYEEKVQIVMYKTSKTEGIEEAVEHMKKGRWKKAKELYEAHMDEVLLNTMRLDNEERMRYFYNYSLCLFFDENYSEAIRVIKQAILLYKNDENVAMLKEYERISGDKEKLKQHGL